MGVLSTRERWTGRLALLALGGVAAGVGIAQAHFHPPVLFQRRATTVRSDSESTPPAAEALPAGAPALGPAEQFDRDTLSDKIDGKADLYLACGFQALRTQRFQAGADAWFEVFQFEMASPDAAFAAFSQQRRRGSPAVAQLGREAYAAGNALFVVQDRFYLELIASEERDDTGDQLVAAARTLLAPLPRGAAQPDPRALFPPDGLIADSVSYHPENGIGYAPFDKIYTARYRLPAGESTVFLGQRATAAEAAQLAADYRAYLAQAGGRAEGEVIALFDLFETVTARGTMLFGVHEAESAAAAEALHAHLAKGLAP